MKFVDEYFSREHRYSLGTEKVSGKKYLSIPVPNSRVDYEEYYEVDPLIFDELLRNAEQAIRLAQKCRNRENDERLMLKPGTDRGV